MNSVIHGHALAESSSCVDSFSKVRDLKKLL